MCSSSALGSKSSIFRGDAFAKEFMLSSLVDNMHYFRGKITKYFLARMLLKFILYCVLAGRLYSLAFIFNAHLFTAELESSHKVKKRFNHWFMLLALDLVVKFTSNYDYNNRKEGADDKLCRLTLLALIVGVVSSYASLSIMFLLTTTFLEKWQSKI